MHVLNSLMNFKEYDIGYNKKLTMESEPLKSDTLSTLKLQFGSFSETLPPAINIDLSINLFSTKVQWNECRYRINFLTLVSSLI